jgi:hypothetical protein
METHEPSGTPETARRPDVLVTAAKAAVGAIGVAAIAFGLWKVRSVIVLLLLSLTFAAAMLPGVEWLHRRKVPKSLAILSFFLPARRARLAQHAVRASAVRHRDLPPDHGLWAQGH